LSFSAERPIDKSADDELGRGSFVERITASLIDPKSNKSKGVVVGITGPWGSGKSSILNLIYNQVLKKFPEALVVKFDPWLISGRDDLIARFISELRASIGDKDSKWPGVVLPLAKYGEALAPMADFFQPGVGVAAKGGFLIIGRQAEKKKPKTTIWEIRKSVREALEQINAPIVILIDEIDRLEDDEIRTICQLVRSVADFPNVSYVLAYDPKRVIQALGSRSIGDPQDLETRGAAYLEKIVQFAFALPIAFDSEIVGLLETELSSLAEELELPGDWQTWTRYKDLIRLLVPSIVSTPRDVKKLLGTVRVIFGAVRGEVDWVDLIGLCTLMIKAPKTSDAIRTEPDAVVLDPLVFSRVLNRIGDSQSDIQNRWGKINPGEEGGPPVRILLEFLFPPLTGNLRTETTPSNAVCLRRPLIIALRYGLGPDDVSRKEIEEFFLKTGPEMEETVRKLFSTGQLRPIFERIEEDFEVLKNSDEEAFWTAISSAIKKPDCEWPTEYTGMHEVVQSIAHAFERIYLDRRKDPQAAKNIFDSLVRGVIRSWSLN
jgi:hypothetical protein